MNYEEIIIKALKESDGVCKSRNYKCPKELTCDECIERFMLSYKESIKKEDQ